MADTNTTFPYRIDVENSPTAGAPAQEVTITDNLDPNLNWSTFQLTGVGFGDNNFTIPAGSQHYQTTTSMTYNGQTFDVEIEAGLNLSTGQVYATFFSLDPATGLPPSSVLTGFLPPEDGTGRGMGYLSFTISPKADLSTGTRIRNVADISFDGAQAIATDQVSDTDPSQGVDPTKQALVTIDSGAPTSSVTGLPSVESSPSFTVSWSGQDDTGGSGIAGYAVWVSDNGGTFQRWQPAAASTTATTTSTSATFTGQIGHTYGFYSIATDNVGNAQPTPPTAQTTTLVDTPPAVSAMIVENGLTERSYVDQLTFQFTKPVTSTATVPMTLTDLGTQGNLNEPVTLTPGEFQWSTVPGTGTSVLAWSLESFAGGTSSLPDGYYKLTLPGSQITDQYGTPLNGGSDYVANFFVLQGDVNGDGVVDSNDMAIVNAALGGRPGGSTGTPTPT